MIKIVKYHTTLMYIRISLKYNLILIDFYRLIIQKTIKKILSHVNMRINQAI